VRVSPHESISFQDLNSGSEAFLFLRRTDDGLALGFAVETDGDLDLTISVVDALRIGTAIVEAASDDEQ
jgi:hypothetical protein